MNSVLDPSIQNLRDTVADFRRASFQSAESVLRRFVQQLDEEPLSGFLAAELPSVDFQAWLKEAQGSVGGLVGSGALEWPADMAARVAMQISLCREIVANNVDFLNFLHDFYYSGRSLSAHITAFASGLLDPLLRDIVRLTELRTVPMVLREAMNKIPTSGDPILDELLEDACTKFRDPAPKARTEATEKLWDAWERLKSLEVQGNKKLSVTRLLDRTSPEPTFRTYLEAEAKSLTEIGNKFHIRHFETDKVSLAHAEQFDYLFHRLYALLHLLLVAGKHDGDDA